jgi:ACS family hexuronate transporter-like MFS transporter
MNPHSPTYNARLVTTLALAMGVMSFDQCGIGFLLPFIKPELHLTNTQIGTIASIYWVAFAVASYGIGILADVRGSARNPLVAVLGIFGLCSLLSGLVGGVGSLLVARAVMGLLAGALLTLGQSVLGACSPPDKVGTNMGLVTGLGSSFSGLVVAPIVLVQIASALGWRAGHVAIALPAWLAAVLVSRNMFQADRAAAKAAAIGKGLQAILSGLRAVTRNRNIVLCAILCSLSVAYVGLGFTFLPIYFVTVRAFSLTQMSALIVVLGLSSILFAIALPAISNRFGRKIVLITACGTSILTPLAAYYYGGSVIVLGVLLFLGWSMSGTGSFSMGIIPAETVHGDLLSRALGSVIALGVLFGGLAGPTIAGWSADHWGPGAPLLVQAACAAIAAFAAMGLHETAPRIVARWKSESRAADHDAPVVPDAAVANGE